MYALSTIVLYFQTKTKVCYKNLSMMFCKCAISLEWYEILRSLYLYVFFTLQWCIVLSDILAQLSHKVITYKYVIHYQLKKRILIFSRRKSIVLKRGWVVYKLTIRLSFDFLIWFCKLKTYYKETIHISWSFDFLRYIFIALFTTLRYMKQNNKVLQV